MTIAGLLSWLECRGMSERKLLFRLTKNDFVITNIKGSGKGGQHRNKKATGVRIKHPESGAQGVATDSKSQKQNRRNAFQRLVDSSEFQRWHRIETARRMLDETEVQRRVERMMAPNNLLVETGECFAEAE